jgi:hypothetical protein
VGRVVTEEHMVDWLRGVWDRRPVSLFKEKKNAWF